MLTAGQVVLVMAALATHSGGVVSICAVFTKYIWFFCTHGRTMAPCTVQVRSGHGM